MNNNGNCFLLGDSVVASFILKTETVKIAMESGVSDTDEVVLSAQLSKQLPEFKSMVSIVICSICYGPVKNPLTTAVEGCGHTFCSLCVRGYLAKFKQQCPQCFKELHDSNLLINRPLKTMTQYIVSLIPKLEALIRGSQTETVISIKKQEHENSNVNVSKDSDKTITFPSNTRYLNTMFFLNLELNR